MPRGGSMVAKRNSDAVALPVSVIIPLLHEYAGLTDSLEAAIAALDASGLTYEAVLVSGGSLAETSLDLARFPAARLIAIARDGNWGGAIMTGSAEARHDIICTLSAETLYVAAEIPRLVGALADNNAAMVVGVRIGIARPIPARRRLLPWLVDMVASDAFGRPVLDLNSSVRLFRRRELDAYAEAMTAHPELPAALTLQMLATEAAVLYLPLDEGPPASARRPRKLREALRLIGLILAVGLAHSRRRTVKPRFAHGAHAGHDARDGIYDDVDDGTAAGVLRELPRGQSLFGQARRYKCVSGCESPVSSNVARGLVPHSLYPPSHAGASTGSARTDSVPSPTLVL